MWERGWGPQSTKAGEGRGQGRRLFLSVPTSAAAPQDTGRVSTPGDGLGSGDPLAPASGLRAPSLRASQVWCRRWGPLAQGALACSGPESPRSASSPPDISPGSTLLPPTASAQRGDPGGVNPPLRPRPEAPPPAAVSSPSAAPKGTPCGVHPPKWGDCTPGGHFQGPTSLTPRTPLTGA